MNMNIEINFLLRLLLLFQFVNCQEEPLIDCSINYYRDEDSVCQLCDEDACKIWLQNKNRKYESCQGFCSSKIDPNQYVTSTITSHPKTTTKPFSNDVLTIKLDQNHKPSHDRLWGQKTLDSDYSRRQNHSIAGHMAQKTKGSGFSTANVIPVVVLLVCAVIMIIFFGFYIKYKNGKQPNSNPNIKMTLVKHFPRSRINNHVKVAYPESDDPNGSISMTLVMDLQQCGEHDKDCKASTD